LLLADIKSRARRRRAPVIIKLHRAAPCCAPRQRPPRARRGMVRRSAGRGKAADPDPGPGPEKGSAVGATTPTARVSRSSSGKHDDDVRTVRGFLRACNTVVALSGRDGATWVR
jgi:hypothetical protein